MCCHKTQGLEENLRWPLTISHTCFSRKGKACLKALSLSWGHTQACIAWNPHLSLTCETSLQPRFHSVGPGMEDSGCLSAGGRTLSSPVLCLLPQQTEAAGTTHLSVHAICQVLHKVWQVPGCERGTDAVISTDKRKQDPRTSLSSLAVSRATSRWDGETVSQYPEPPGEHPPPNKLLKATALLQRLNCTQSFRSDNGANEALEPKVLGLRISGTALALGCLLA